MSTPSTPPAEHLQGTERAKAVVDIFDRVAHRYDLMNKIMTGGMDRFWRQFVIRMANLPIRGKLLDIATGTGDLAFETVKQHPEAFVVGADFVPRMMLVGQQRPLGKRVRWTTADALNLPYAENTFDAVTHGFLVRNVIDIPRALAEQFRVLKHSGRVVCLDTTPPPDNLLRPLVVLYMTRIIPFIGTILTGQRDAYSYLPNSSLGFKSAEELAMLFRQAGFVKVGFKRFMFGTVAVHWGVKP